MFELFPASREVAGLHVNEIGAGGSDIRLDALLRAVAERHHRHDGADADDHPEHREHGAQGIAAKRPGGKAKAGEEQRHGLLVPQRLDRIELRGLACGIPAEEDANERRDAERQHDGPDRNRR